MNSAPLHFVHFPFAPLWINTLKALVDVEQREALVLIRERQKFACHLCEHPDCIQRPGSYSKATAAHSHGPEITPFVPGLVNENRRRLPPISHPASITSQR